MVPTQPPGLAHTGWSFGSVPVVFVMSSGLLPWGAPTPLAGVGWNTDSSQLPTRPVPSSSGCL